jgi:hypothetical protein
VRSWRAKVNAVWCTECGECSGLLWTGWRAYRVDEPGSGEPPQLVFYCPACAEREFGDSVTEQAEQQRQGDA